MSQITIYLDEESEKTARAAAAAANLPLSRWFALLVAREGQRGRKTGWQSFFAEADKQKAAWDEFPLTEDMHKDLPPDTPRESL